MKRAIPFAAAVAALALACSCASDNVHQPEPLSMPEPVATTGVLASTIPDFPFFGPVEVDNHATLTFTDTGGTRATLVLGAFTLYVEEMSLRFTIGELTVENVSVSRDASGNQMLAQPAFECQAGNYYTKGSLSGTLAADGTLNFTLRYKPGSMPFLVVSEYIGK